jgi:hypothetical protein
MKLNIEKICWGGVYFHPDLIRATSLNDKFFNYEVSEALHLSDKEKNILLECVQKINLNLKKILMYIANTLLYPIELLLNYAQILWQTNDYKPNKQINNYSNRKYFK